MIMWDTRPQEDDHMGQQTSGRVCINDNPGVVPASENEGTDGNLG